MGQLRAGAPGGPARAGRPSSAERLNLSTRSLRVGVVYNGRIVQERLMPPGSTVTVGSDPDCTIVVARTPRRFTLIETRPGREAFHFTDAMRGKVALGGRTRTLDGLLSDGRAQRGRRRSTMRLRPEHRGKVLVGDTTILFQFVRTPPMPARRIGTRFRAWHWGMVDWLFLAVLLLSGLVHTAAMIWIESQPPASIEVIRAMGDRFTVYVETPPPEATPEPVEVEDDLLAAAPEPEVSKDPEPGSDGSTGATESGPEIEAPPETVAEREARLEKEVSGTGLIALIGHTGEGSNHQRVRDLLADGTVGGAHHDAIASARVGGDRTDGLGGLRRGSAEDGIAGSVDLEDVEGVERGRAIKEAEELPGNATTGDWEPAPGQSTGYDVQSQVKRILGRMRQCYEKELKGDPDLAGKIVLSWTIQADGDVAGVDVERDSTGSADLQACVKKTMGRLRFAAPGFELDVEGYPLLFDRQ